MERYEIKSIIEALIFVSEEPMTIDLVAMVLEGKEVDKKTIREVVDELKNEYAGSPEKGIHIVEVAGGYQLRTKPQTAEWIQRLNVPRPVRLSQPALETLSIIAYRQPAMRSDIENIRGVDTGGVLKTLLEKGLIRILGKSDEAGNPLVYGTTKAFLELFGLNSLKDLPTLKEIEQLEVQEKVGDLGKEDALQAGDVSAGVGSVIAEYKDGIEEFKHDPEKLIEDKMAIHELEKSIRNLRDMEKDIFPKEKEELQIISKETGETFVVGETGGTDGENETTPAQDTGEIDGTVA